jgi:hypothetical protein
MNWKSKKSFLLFLVVVCTPILIAADLWEKKVSSTWTEKECRKILTDSPWAFSKALSSRQTLEFRLLTAKPIRLALDRLQLLNSERDASLDKTVKQYDDPRPGNEIIVQISYRNPKHKYSIHGLHALFKDLTFADFVSNTFLVSSNGVHVPISKFLPITPQRTLAAFVFPRLDENGNQLFTGQEKSISLISEIVINNRPFESALNPFYDPTYSSDWRISKYKIFVEMKPKDMWFDGKFEM